MAFSLVQQIPSRVQTQLVHFVSSASPYPQYQKCLASALVPATLRLRLFRNPWRIKKFPLCSDCVFVIKIYKITGFTEFSEKVIIELILAQSSMARVRSKRRIWKSDAFQPYSHVQQNNKPTVFLGLFKFCTLKRIEVMLLYLLLSNPAGQFNLTGP